jgi:hypothetical protein
VVGIESPIARGRVAQTEQVRGQEIELNVLLASVDQGPSNVLLAFGRANTSAVKSKSVPIPCLSSCLISPGAVIALI